VEVTGPIDVTLYVGSDAKDTDFTVKLIDVLPDGTAYNIEEKHSARSLPRRIYQAARVDGKGQSLQSQVSAYANQQLF
jgi:predicted acyl esterase